MARVIVFGTSDCAALASVYLRHDSEHEVSAFTVTRDYLPNELEFDGKPVVPFEELERHYPPQQFHLLVAASPRRMNRFREGIYTSAKKRGYPFISYISSHATVFDDTPIGENCFILENTTIQPFCRIGNNVMIWSGSVVCHHTTIADHTMLAPGVAVSGNCTMESFCFLGVNSCVRNGVKMAEGTLLAMGANLCGDTDPWSLYMGNPARKQPVASTDLELM